MKKEFDDFNKDDLFQAFLDLGEKAFCNGIYLEKIELSYDCPEGRKTIEDLKRVLPDQETLSYTKISIKGKTKNSCRGVGNAERKRD